MVGSNHVMVRSIRSEIEYRIKSYNYTLSKLSELTNINAGHLSGFLKGNPIRALTIDQLNAIGRAFGEPTGWLYDLYVEECFQRGKVSKRRVRPYLVQCAELGRHDCIQMVIPQLLEDPKNIEVLFAVAEQLFYKGKQKESAYFYQLVVDNEKNSHSERSVISQYRLFRALLGNNAEENGKAVIRFEPFRKRLSEGHQLDALLHLANVSFTLHKWKEVEKYADELRELATLVYENERNKQKNNRKGEPLKTERHLVVYYGQAYLLKSEALEKQGLYKKANEYAAGYADLGWFDNLDEVGQKEVQKFRLWARANRYTFDLLMGQLDILPDYLAFLEENPTELLAGLVTIVESANKYNFTIDSIIEKFSIEISCFDEYKDTINVERHLRFRYQLAIYQFKNERFHSGIVETLRCLILSTATNDHKNFIRCVTLFEAHRYHATEQQKQEYKKIMEEVRNDESLFAFAGNDLWVV